MRCRHDTIRPMTSDASARLHVIAEQLATLSKTLSNNTDPESRRTLLKKFRALLAEADRVVAREIPNE